MSAQRRTAAARWHESRGRALRFPDDTDAALARVWQLAPDPHDPDVVWAGVEPHALWRSADGGETLRAGARPVGPPAPAEWEPGFGGGAVHTILPDPRTPTGCSSP